MKTTLKKLETHFAAIGLSEGDRDMAREFMEAPANTPAETGVSYIGNLVRQIENSFAAAGLAEADPDMARRFIQQKEGIRHSPSWVVSLANSLKLFKESFERTFAAAALAEGSLEMARDYLEIKDRPQAGFNEFLESVGLRGIPVQYGIAVI